MSGLWEFVARYSGATVPESHGVPRHLAATKLYFKEQTSSYADDEKMQDNFIFLRWVQGVNF